MNSSILLPGCSSKSKKEASHTSKPMACTPLCNRHLRMLTRISSSKTSSKMLQYLIQKSLSGNIFRVYGRRCPVCEHLDGVEKQEVMKAARDPLKLASGDFVCLGHLKKVLDFSQPEDKEKILNAYRDSLRKLLDQLKVLSAENYYQVAAEVRSSLWRSVEKLAGRK